LVEHQVSRRKVLGGVLLSGAGLVLAGCQSSGGTVAAAGLPGPIWPDQEPKPWVPPKPAPAPVAVNPTPAPPRNVAAPGVIPRGRWTRSNVIASRANPMNGINRITIHHTAMSSSSVRTESDVIRMLNNVRTGHLQRGWADLGYHYAVDPQGRVWEGRPLNWQGAHVEDQNEHNMGIVLLGNFDTQSPTADQLAALDGFVSQQAARYRVGVGRIYTHQELGRSACPGRNLQKYMLATRASGRGRLAMALA
jgi:hypothetical protein